MVWGQAKIGKMWMEHHNTPTLLSVCVGSKVQGFHHHDLSTAILSDLTHIYPTNAADHMFCYGKQSIIKIYLPSYLSCFTLNMGLELTVPCFLACALVNKLKLGVI